MQGYLLKAVLYSQEQMSIIDSMAVVLLQQSSYAVWCPLLGPPDHCTMH